MTSVGTNYTFTDREDDGNGLMYYRNRYYSPSMKRFISEDPVGLQGGLNQYAYVEGNLLAYNDPSGNCDVDVELSKISGLPGIIGYCHASITTNDPITVPLKPNRTLFRGGSEFQKRNNWGRIRAISGDYNGSIDYQEHPYKSFTVFSNSDSCGDVNNILSQGITFINNENIPYNPIKPNSNSVAYTLLLDLGVPNINYSNIDFWGLPGWGLPLQ